MPTFDVPLRRFTVVSSKSFDAVMASLMETIGRVYLSLGLTAEARPQLEKALAMREKLFPGDHESKASNLAALGGLELASGRMDTAQKHYEDALAMNEVEADFAVVAAGIVKDFSFDRKSPPFMCETWVLESELHGPILCGCLRA